MRENLLHGVWLSFSILRNGEGHLQLCCWAVSEGSEQETRSLPLSFDDSSSWFCTFGISLQTEGNKLQAVKDTSLWVHSGPGQ